MRIELPPPKAVLDMLTVLIDRPVEVSTGYRVSNEHCEVLGIYVGESTAMTAVLALDLPAAAYLGCAVSVVPPAVAEVAIRAGRLPAEMLDNVTEVFHVFGGVLGDFSPMPQRLYSVHQAETDAPPDALTLAATLGNRLDLQLSVSGYGVGQLSCVLAV